MKLRFWHNKFISFEREKLGFMLNTVNTIELEKTIASFELKKLGEGVYEISNGNEKPIILEVLAVDLALKTISIRHNHRIHDMVFKNNLDLVLDKMGIKRNVDTISTDIKAPMPGKVIAILVNEGDAVKKGDGILILEAMKMENVLKAEHDCTVKKVMVSKGVNVEKNELLIELM